ncbi:pyrimidine 5-nucleotidase [Phanerochaete sordida]|uniref:Pyrimidine 5-nucleotidase n=1 Tax=Phanerochaete sordida TaxID=48140 RepID=A0A9P3L6M5_9APHY|nr:pyrimidine 5-nucleotidase [Phanerochaete sordida]
MTVDISQTSVDDRYVIFFDIDNTLYSASSKISQAMGERIHAYFLSLGLEEERATELHHKYYTEYGLALRGLVRHHEIDPLDFDKKCDGSLPLEEMIKPDPHLRQLLQDIDRSKARVWALTNAYKTHAHRVLRILGVDDLIEGVIFCDYGNPKFSCKPEPQFYLDAMQKAAVSDPKKIFFIDDSRNNVAAAAALGWGSCVHFCEAGLETVEGGKAKQISADGKEPLPGAIVVGRLEELRSVWSEVFKTTEDGSAKK